VVEDWSDNPRELGLALPTTPKEKHAIIRKCKKTEIITFELGRGGGVGALSPVSYGSPFLPPSKQTCNLKSQKENLTFRDAAAMVQRKRN